MARVGGRNTWIAVPAGIACAAVVAALVWLSLPMVPVTLAWAGDMLRNATTPAPERSPGDTPAGRAAAGEPVDCRAMYSDSLWNEVMWTGRTILDQSLDPPATSVTALAEVVDADVRATCLWTASHGLTVVSTLAAVGDGAPAIAEAALRGQGLACAVGDSGLHCAGTVGDAIETHVFRDGFWLVSVETTWRPEDYAARLERHVFG